VLRICLVIDLMYGVVFNRCKIYCIEQIEFLKQSRLRIFVYPYFFLESSANALYLVQQKPTLYTTK
jgi:hypothetical protein